MSASHAVASMQSYSAYMRVSVSAAWPVLWSLLRTDTACAGLATETLSAGLAQIQDRLKIRKAGRGPDVLLSRQTMLNCGAFEGNGAGCDGGACALCTPHARPFWLA